MHQIYSYLYWATITYFGVVALTLADYIYLSKITKIKKNLELIGYTIRLERGIVRTRKYLGVRRDVLILIFKTGPLMAIFWPAGIPILLIAMGMSIFGDQGKRFRYLKNSLLSPEEILFHMYDAAAKKPNRHMLSANVFIENTTLEIKVFGDTPDEGYFSDNVRVQLNERTLSYGDKEYSFLINGDDIHVLKSVEVSDELIDSINEHNFEAVDIEINRKASKSDMKIEDLIRFSTGTFSKLAILRILSSNKYQDIINLDQTLTIRNGIDYHKALFLDLSTTSELKPLFKHSSPQQYVRDFFSLNGSETKSFSHEILELLKELHPDEISFEQSLTECVKLINAEGVFANEVLLRKTISKKISEFHEKSGWGESSENRHFKTYVDCVLYTKYHWDKLSAFQGWSTKAA